jgi:PAS domain S-box-containing protein
MSIFERPTKFIGNWLTPTVVVFLIGCGLSLLAAMLLRQNDLNQLRTEFELRSTSVIAFIQYDSSRVYAVEIAQSLDQMAAEIATLGIDDSFAGFSRYATTTRNIIWLPQVDSIEDAQSLIPGPYQHTPHPLLSDIPDLADANLSQSVNLLPVERQIQAPEDAVNLRGLVFNSHDILGTLLDLAREFNTTALFSRYSAPSDEPNLPYMNLRLHLKPVFLNNDSQAELLGFIGIAVLSDMATDLISSFAPPGGIELVSLENRESLELRDAISSLRPIIGGSRADRGSGATDIVTIARPEFLEASSSARSWYAFGSGFVFSLLVAGYVRLASIRTDEISRLVSRRTMDLSRSNNQLQMEILEREKAETTLRNSEENYRLLAEHITDIIWRSDLKLTLTYCSPSAYAVLGYTPEELLVLSWDVMFTPESLERLLNQTQSDRMWSYTSGLPVPEHMLELELIHKNGHTVHCEIHFRMYLNEDKQPVGYVGVTRDITQRRAQEAEKAMLEAQLFQARKMEAIGSLAGGVAHDFNNLLTGIMGYSTLLESRSDLGPEVKKASAVITAAAERGRKLTQNLLGFARRGKFENKSLDLTAIVTEVSALLKQTADPSIKILWDTETEPHYVFGDPDQLHLAVLNLIVNARDSLSNGGTIELNIEVTESADTENPLKSSVENRKLVQFSVRDDGPGIPDEIRDRIFEPFFTTKEQGQGTGLGLATVYGIIEHHGGDIDVQSTLGKGTTFTVTLPLVEAQSSIDSAPSLSPQEGKGTVLIVDDDEDVRSAVGFILESLGYSIIIARDGVEALQLYSDQREQIDVVLLDWRMPGMNGDECFDKLREIDPDIRAVLSTGFGQEGMAQSLIEKGMQGFIRKPYRAQELAEVIANVLDDTVTSAS